MSFGGRGNWIAMDIVGVKDLLRYTFIGHKYNISIIDCFTRNAIVVFFFLSSSQL